MERVGTCSATTTQRRSDGDAAIPFHFAKQTTEKGYMDWKCDSSYGQSNALGNLLLNTFASSHRKQASMEIAKKVQTVSMQDMSDEIHHSQGVTWLAGQRPWVATVATNEKGLYVWPDAGLVHSILTIECLSMETKGKAVTKALRWDLFEMHAFQQGISFQIYQKRK